MNTPQQQYAQYVQQSQETLHAAVDAWTKTVEDSVAAIPSHPTQVDAQKVVDQVFDFAERLREMQRGFTTSLVQKSVSFSQNLSGPGHPDVSGEDQDSTEG